MEAGTDLIRYLCYAVDFDMNAKHSERARALLVLAFYLLLNVTVGTCIAIVMQSRGYGWIASILLGAASSVYAFALLADIINHIRYAIWRRTRGYPFAKGDFVEVTSGSLRGAHGRVVALGQAPWVFEVEIENTHRTNEFSAGRLRKVGNEIKS
jgi:hypothetical protein